ncbi:MAG: insulinase family protein [Verrucomicrobiaceae bacterium]|nr:insulinase family protein [Verrucomicrobiaceae bacterium]
MRHKSARVTNGRAPAAGRGAHITLPPARAEVRTLDNGLEVIVQQDHSHPLASVQVWVRAGSIHEERWTGAGLAHLVEHMVFKGTTRRTAQEISRTIQHHGGQVNAYTSFNRTVYWIDGLSEQVDAYLDVLADMVMHSKLDADELAREMDVIRREMAMDNDDPNSAAQHLMQATAFRKHPLRHPVIGYREVFDQVAREDVEGFVRRHYAPNNCFVIITGAVEPQAAFAAVERHFKAWRRRPYEAVMQPEEPRQMGPRRNTRTFATELTRVSFGWVIPGEADEEKAALDVLGFLLGGGKSSRLYQELREKRGLAHYVWAGAWATQECGLFNVEIECDPGDAAAAEKAALEAVERMRQRGPTATELSKAVRTTLGSQLRALMTTRGQASSLGHGWLTAGSLDFAALHLGSIERLTPAKIRDAALRHLDPRRMNVTIVEPQTAGKPEAVDAAGSRCEKIERMVLPGGLTLIVGENPKLPLVSLRAQFLAGVPVETDENAGVTQVAAQMLMKGTRTRSAAELASVLENRGGGIVTQGDVHRLILGADVLRGDEALGMDLLADLALNAQLPAAQLPLVQKRQIAAIREEQEDPLTVALRLCRKKIFAGVPYARTALGTEQTVKDLTVAACRDVLARHVCAANGVISVFGDVKAKTVRALVERVFAKLPKGRRDASGAAAFRGASKPGEWDQKLDKEQAVLVIGFRTVGLQDTDSYALSLIDEACSDMGSRLFNRIREELGLAYYVGAQSFAALGAGAFYFYVGTDAAKIELAEKEMKEQISDLAASGLAADEIERAKTTWRSSWLRAQQGNPALADGIGWDELNGLGHDHILRLPAIMDALTPAEVRRAAAKYLRPGAAFVVRVLPE